MMPVIPHIANECLNRLNYNEKIQWPKVNQKYLLEEVSEIVIQVNGKKRGIISVTKNIGEQEIIDEIKNKKLIDKFLKIHQIKKTIYVKDRLINYIIN